MTMRVIVRTFDASAAAAVNAPVEQWIQTFDIEDEKLEAFLRSNKPSLGGREVIGVELLPPNPQTGDENERVADCENT